MTATYKIAMAAAMDAGNRNARRAGRSVWSEEDRDVAIETFHKIMAVAA